MKINRAYREVISWLLCFVLVVYSLAGCQYSEDKSNTSPSITPDMAHPTEAPSITPKIDTTSIAEEIITSFEKRNDEEQKEIEAITLSTQWEEYIGDVETFINGLIASSLMSEYDVFPAYVELNDSTEVYGLAYTNYTECFTTEDEKEVYFVSGFIANSGDDNIENLDLDSELLLYNMNGEVEDTHFILGYLCDEFKAHCVVYEKYVTYGVNDLGQIEYEYKDYIPEEYDKGLGELYSYDERKYLYDDRVGVQTQIEATTLYSQIDYQQLQNEMNEIIKIQDKNFASVDLQSNFYVAKEAVNEYLLKTYQFEEFLGYNVDSLVEIANQLELTECLQITDDGLEVVSIKDVTAQGESALVKWIVGTVCIAVTAVGMVTSAITIECPPLSSLSSAITGAAIEIFMQVIVGSEKLANVDMRKVAIVAVTGAVSGYIGPYLSASKLGNVATFFADSVIDGLLGGVEQAVTAWMDGKEGLDIIKSFGYGTALGFSMSAAFKAVSNVAGKVLGKLASKIGSATKKILPKVTKKVSGSISNIGKSLSKKFYKLKKAVDSTRFHNEYIADKLKKKQIDRILKFGDELLKDKSIKATRTDSIFDMDGNAIKKEDLYDMFDKATDDSIFAKFKIGDEEINIIKQNGAVGIAFDEKKYQSVVLDNIFVDSRAKNMTEAAGKFKQEWIKDPSKIPSSISMAIESAGLDINSITPQKLKSIIQNSDMVLHEGMDLHTVTLVSRIVHDKANETGISHMGGFGLIKYLKNHMGIECFDRLVNAASSAFALAH